MCFIFCLLQMFTDGLECCGLLVDYCDVFISCLDSHSDSVNSFVGRARTSQYLVYDETIKYVCM